MFMVKSIELKGKNKIKKVSVYFNDKVCIRLYSFHIPFIYLFLFLFFISLFYQVYSRVVFFYIVTFSINQITLPFVFFSFCNETQQFSLNTTQTYFFHCHSIFVLGHEIKNKIIQI